MRPTHVHLRTILILPLSVPIILQQRSPQKIHTSRSRRGHTHNQTLNACGPHAAASNCGPRASHTPRHPPILQQRLLSRYMHMARTLLRPIADTTLPSRSATTVALALHAQDHLHIHLYLLHFLAVAKTALAVLRVWGFGGHSLAEGANATLYARVLSNGSWPTRHRPPHNSLVVAWSLHLVFCRMFAVVEDLLDLATRLLKLGKVRADALKALHLVVLDRAAHLIDHRSAATR